MNDSVDFKLAGVCISLYCKVGSSLLAGMSLSTGNSSPLRKCKVMYQTVPDKTNSDQALPQQDPANKSIVKEE